MKVILQVQRYNPERDSEPYYQQFVLEAGDDKERILDLLHQAKWKYDGTLTFRRSCAHGVCGSDAIRINGRNRLACSTLLRDVNYTKPIVIEPIPSLPVIKDLIVDMSDFYKKYEAVKPYLTTKTPPPEHERLQSNEDAEKLFESAKCILCACCTTSCPSSWSDENYIGPAALLKAYRFVFDTRDEAADERLDVIDTPDGIWRCHTIFNCVEACPKEINVTWHISQLKKRLAEREM